MKKYILIGLVFLTTPVLANAGGAFSSIKDAKDEKTQEDDEAKERDIKRLEQEKEAYEELKKMNQINAEISGKLDALIQSSEMNNKIMQQLLDRTR